MVAISSYSPLKLLFCTLLMKIALQIVYKLNLGFYSICFSPLYICFEILIFEIALKLQELSTKKSKFCNDFLNILRYSPHKTEFNNSSWTCSKSTIILRYFLVQSSGHRCKKYYNIRTMTSCWMPSEHMDVALK